jgi:hypothetical protein
MRTEMETSMKHSSWKLSSKGHANLCTNKQLLRSVAVLACALAVCTPASRAQQAAPSPGQPPTPFPSQPATGAPTSRLDFQVRLGGLYPKSVTVPAGICQIVALNGTVAAPVNEILTNSSGQTVAQTLSAAAAQTSLANLTRSRQRLIVNLTQGTYKLQVVGRADWVATITVTAKGN